MKITDGKGKTGLRSAFADESSGPEMPDDSDSKNVRQRDNYIKISNDRGGRACKRRGRGRAERSANGRYAVSEGRLATKFPFIYMGP